MPYSPPRFGIVPYIALVVFMLLTGIICTCFPSGGYAKETGTLSHRITSAALSPLGDRIALTIWPLEPTKDSSGVVLIYDVPRRTFTRLPSLYGWLPYAPAFSPTGKHLAYATICPALCQTAYPQSKISIVDLSTQNVSDVSVGDGYRNYPSFSPNGDLLVFVKGSLSFRNDKSFDSLNSLVSLSLNDKSESTLLSFDDGFQWLYEPRFVQRRAVHFVAMAPRADYINNQVKLMKLPDGRQTPLGYSIPIIQRESNIARAGQIRMLPYASSSEYAGMQTLAVSASGQRTTFVNFPRIERGPNPKPFEQALYLVEGEAPRRIAKLAPKIGYAAMSGNGKIALILSDTSGNNEYDVTIIEIDTGTTELLHLKNQLSKVAN